jgi:hypothetical protein
MKDHDALPVCPGCGRQVNYLEEVVAAPADGRVWEYHRPCLPERLRSRRGNVGDRLAKIVERAGNAR